MRLLRLRQVVLEDLLQRLALERHQALVELAALEVLQSHRQAAIAQQLPFAVDAAFEAPHSCAIPRICSSAVQSATSSLTGPEPCTCRVTRPGALLIRAQKYVECGGMTQQSCDIFGVAAAVQHALPGPRQADQPPPNVQIFEEKALNVVRLHGSKV